MTHTRPNYAAAAALLAFATLSGIPALAATPVMPAIADPATNTYIPGKFIWFDLVTGDTSASQKFYGKVFDWKFEKVRGSAEQYAVIRNDGKAIGGIFRPNEVAGAKVGARWLSFASVANMDLTVTGMTARGAQLLLPATTVPGRGVHAILRDSQGALIGLLHSSSGDRADAPVESGEFFWVDLYARDPAAAANAYKEFGYEVYSEEVTGDERLVLSAKGYARAGILKLPPEGREPGWLAYVQVDDVPTTLARVRAAGGKVLREPDPAILDGQFAVFSDPQGGILGVLHWPSTATAGVQP